MNEPTIDDWNRVKKYFDDTRRQYMDLEGVQGVNTSFALRLVFDPLAKRLNSGERTIELYDAMREVQ